jgi:cytochrome c2
MMFRVFVASMLVFSIGDFACAAEGGDAAAGKVYFSQSCSQCHSAVSGDDGGEIGPTLFGLVGREAGSGDKNFPYSKALKESKLVWNSDALDRFLEDPPAAVPGTSMPMPVPAKQDRDNLIAYFQSLLRGAK